MQFRSPACRRPPAAPSFATYSDARYYSRTFAPTTCSVISCRSPYCSIVRPTTLSFAAVFYRSHCYSDARPHTFRTPTCDLSFPSLLRRFPRRLVVRLATFTFAHTSAVRLRPAAYLGPVVCSRPVSVPTPSFACLVRLFVRPPCSYAVRHHVVVRPRPSLAFHVS